MSSQVTEIATASIKPGLDLISDSSEAKKALFSSLAAIKKTKGCQQVFWGRQVENPDIVELAIGTQYSSITP